MQHITININNVQQLNIQPLGEGGLSLKGTDTEITISEVKPKEATNSKEVEQVKTIATEKSEVRNTPLSIYRGEIWLAELTDTKYLKHGEQGGFRPVLIVQNNIGNRYSPTVVALCITSKHKKDLPTHVTLPKKYSDDKESIVLCEQVKTISKERLNRRLGIVSEDMMKVVDSKILFSLGLDGSTV